MELRDPVRAETVLLLIRFDRCDAPVLGAANATCGWIDRQTSHCRPFNLLFIREAKRVELRIAEKARPAPTQTLN